MRPLSIKAVVLPMTVAVGFGLVACGDDGPSEETLRFTEGESVLTNTLDVEPAATGPEDLSLGDAIIFNKPLFDEDGEPAGTIRATCTAMTEGDNPTGMCDGVIELTDGTLAFSEVFRVNDEFRTVAITGGTDTYAGATGTLRGGEGVSDDGTIDEIHLFLP